MMKSTAIYPGPSETYNLEDIGCRLTWNGVGSLMPTFQSCTSKKGMQGELVSCSDPKITRGHVTDDNDDESQLILEIKS